jgi:BASS family bile acid:Na+ symporter
LIPGLEADPWPLLRPPLLTMLLPLAAGMAVRRAAAGWAAVVRPGVERVSTVCMVAAVLLLVSQNARAMLATFGSGAALTAVLFDGLCTAAGYAPGGPTRETGAVLGVGTGQRNVAAALVVATQNFTDPGLVVMLLVATLAGLVVLVPAARAWARPAAAPAEPATGVRP